MMQLHTFIGRPVVQEAYEQRSAAQFPVELYVKQVKKGRNSPVCGSIKNIYPSLNVKRSGDTLFFEARWDMELPEDYAKWVYPMYKFRNPLGNLWYDQKYRVKARLVGYGNYSKIILPGFNFKRVRTQKYMDQVYRSGNSAKILLNEFDQTYINMIPETDTVAIEEYTYIMERR